MVFGLFCRSTRRVRHANLLLKRFGREARILSTFSRI